MKTRTTGKRETLEDRCYERRIKRPGWTDADGHVRAELQRVARQVRRLKTYDVRYCSRPSCKACNSGPQRVLRSDVLEILREAGR